LIDLSSGIAGLHGVIPAAHDPGAKDLAAAMKSSSTSLSGMNGFILATCCTVVENAAWLAIGNLVGAAVGGYLDSRRLDFTLLSLALARLALPLALAFTFRFNVGTIGRLSHPNWSVDGNLGNVCGTSGKWKRQK